MKSVAILSDTHIPSRAERLPPWVADTVTGADLVIHAGDFDSERAYDRIDALAGRLVAVTGNADPDLGLPEVAQVEVDGVSLVVTHGSGPLAGYRSRVLDAVRSVDPAAVGVSGHTHEPADVTVAGVRLLNPGSATGAAPAATATMLHATVDDGRLHVETLEAP